MLLLWLWGYVAALLFLCSHWQTLLFERLLLQILNNEQAAKMLQLLLVFYDIYLYMFSFFGYGGEKATLQNGLFMVIFTVP